MELHVLLDGPGKRAQLEHHLRDAVRSGRLPAGTRLPPSRALAADLGVSRGVVVDAYGQLVAEGWLRARRGAGTVVAPAPVTAPATPAPAPPRPAAALAAVEPPPAYDLRSGRPDLSAFPRAAWHAALGRALRTLPEAALGYGDPAGHAGLRAALAAHLARGRDVRCHPGQLVVCGGVSGGLATVLCALRARGARRVAVEDPGWRGQRAAIAHAGLEAVPVPVDDDGLVVAALPDDVDAVCVTPAHHFPLGVVLAPGRRAELVAWARARDAILLEDDYDAEYRYDRAPVGALQALAPDRVVYAGSASKTLAPALRLGWVVAPERLAAEVAAVHHAAQRGLPVIDQAAFADLLERGEVDRHLRRMRRRYRVRRDVLTAALARHAPMLDVGGAAAGLQLLAWLPPDADEAAVAAAALRRGVAVDRLGHRGVRTAHPPALILGYAALAEPALERAAQLLGQAVTST